MKKVNLELNKDVDSFTARSSVVAKRAPESERLPEPGNTKVNPEISVVDHQ